MRSTKLNILTGLLVIFSLILTGNSFAGEYNFGDGSTKTLTAKSWSALQTKDYAGVSAYVDKCVSVFSKKALEQQASLTNFPPSDEANNYWALNDVATCLFIKGKSLREQGKKDEAKKVFEDIIKNYRYGQCWDSNGWFWKMADAANDQIMGMEKNVDFGNYTSETLTKKAWESLEKEEFDKVEIYVDKCLDLFEKTAKEQQSTLTDFASKEKAFDYWALNDVGTSLFVKAKALAQQGKKDEAKKVLKNIIDDYGFSQCWDVKGWFWKVSQGAKDQIVSIESGVDFGNMTSEALTGKAWESFSAGKYKDVETYVNKCVQLYGKKADEMQASLKNFAEEGKEFDYWALNDVGTCLFILGRSHYIQGQNNEAKKVYNKIMDKYTYAQTYDVQGWFWRPSEASKDQMLLMETGIDFGDYTSQTLTTKAWQALDAGNYDEVLVFTRKCIQLYRKTAEKMQSKLDSYASKEKAFDNWALNDIGTCYFIMGEAYLAKKDHKKALESYRTLVDTYFYSQCWDAKGWFWKPAVAARGKINKIAAEYGLM